MVLNAQSLKRLEKPSCAVQTTTVCWLDVPPLHSQHGNMSGWQVQWQFKSIHGRTTKSRFKVRISNVHSVYTKPHGTKYLLHLSQDQKYWNRHRSENIDVSTLHSRHHGVELNDSRSTIQHRRNPHFQNDSDSNTHSHENTNWFVTKNWWVIDAPLNCLVIATIFMLASALVSIGGIVDTWVYNTILAVGICFALFFAFVSVRVQRHMVERTLFMKDQHNITLQVYFKRFWV